MTMRVKNIAAGFYDAGGFHPIRSSADYDPDRAGDEYSQRPTKRRKKKAVAKRRHNPRASGGGWAVYEQRGSGVDWPVEYGTKAGMQAHARRLRKIYPGKKFVAKLSRIPPSRTGNPIPTKWVSANVKRVGNDIQVMLFPKGKVAKRRKAQRVVRRRNPQAGVTQFSARARCWGTLKTNKFRVDSDGTVRAWDSVAGHYTIHHGMTKREESRIRNMAARRR